MIKVKTEDEIAAMRPAGKLAAELLKMIEPYVKPGVATQTLNDLCHDYTLKAGAIPAPLNYKGNGKVPFPRSICTSVNEVVCHGIPSKEHILRDGDIVNIDVTVILDGYHGDTSRTFLVGQNHPPRIKQLVRCAEECLQRAIEVVSLEARLGDIGAAIQEHAEKQGFTVVRDFVGHGIGTSFHEEPQVSHVGSRGKGQRLVPGMTFTIEPMINVGDWRTKILRDGWTAVTLDRSWSAQFEHTIALHHDGRVEVLTA